MILLKFILTFPNLLAFSLLSIICMVVNKYSKVYYPCPPHNAFVQKLLALLIIAVLWLVVLFLMHYIFGYTFRDIFPNNPIYDE